MVRTLPSQGFAHRSKVLGGFSLAGVLVVVSVGTLACFVRNGLTNNELVNLPTDNNVTKNISILPRDK